MKCLSFSVAFSLKEFYVSLSNSRAQFNSVLTIVSVICTYQTDRKISNAQKNESVIEIDVSLSRQLKAWVINV